MNVFKSQTRAVELPRFHRPPAMRAQVSLSNLILGTLYVVLCMTLALVVPVAHAEPLFLSCKPSLDAHNGYRAKHCVPPLMWSVQLASSAQQWANRCDFNHDDQTPHGENLFWGTSGAYSPQAAVAAWYEEIAEYKFSAPDFSEQAGHFTQVVWRGSKQLGCGMATCRGNHFWVCRYSPPGNVTGQFSRNVPKTCP